MSPCRFTRPHTIGLGTLILCVCLLPAPGWAQETRATVAGTVIDDQGAVVPGVTVTVLNTDTNVSHESVTNQTGVFTVQKIQPGPVKVTASVPGFKTFVRDEVRLPVGFVARIDTAMAITPPAIAV